MATSTIKRSDYSYYVPGDSIFLDYVTFVGFVTSGSTNFRGEINLPKTTDLVSGFNATNCLCSIRIPSGGYLYVELNDGVKKALTDGTDITGYPYYVVKGNGIQIGIEAKGFYSDSGYSQKINNVPLVCLCTLSGTFK